MFPDLPLESGESGLEKLPSHTAPPLLCQPLPQTLISSSPSLPPRASHLDRVVSELPGRHAPGNPLSSSDLKDGTAGRAPDHRGSGLHPGFPPPAPTPFQRCQGHIWHLFLCPTAQSLLSPKFSPGSLKTDVCRKESGILPALP